MSEGNERIFDKIIQHLKYLEANITDYSYWNFKDELQMIETTTSVLEKLNELSFEQYVEIRNRINEVNKLNSELNEIEPPF